MRQLLKLQHHKHTGKLLHHHHTSYRGLAVVFVLAGVVMLGLGVVNHAAADMQFGVTATVNVPRPSQPPLIFSPSSNATVTGNSALVYGSCPLVTPQVVVVVTVNGNPAGTGACDAQNDFAVPVTLTGGTEQIVASSLTISGQTGPASDVVNITAPATISPASAAIPIADSPFSSIGADRTVVWQGTIGTSQDKLHVHVDWGDGHTSQYTVTAGAQSFSHQYATSASHNVVLSVADNYGASNTIQFAAAAYTTAAAYGSGSLQTLAPLHNARTVTGLYGLYITAVAVTGIIWLEAKHAARALVHQGIAA